MRKTGLQRLFSAIFSAVLLSTGAGAWAQSFPNRPVKMIVPFPPGGGLDAIARELASHMSSGLGQPVVIDNRAGAGGAIGTEATARASADGYTVLMTTDGHAMIPYLQKVTWDPVKDFVPISTAGTYNLVLVAHPSLNVASVADLIRVAKASPGKLSYGSSGVGGAVHIAFEMFKTATGIDLVHVPYKGLGALSTAMLTGEVPVGINGMAATPHIRAGKLRGLGVTGSKRWSVIPDVPTIAEAGVPSFVFEGWIGLLAPAGTPRDVIGALNAEMVKAAAAPEVRQRLSALGFDAVSSTPEQFSGMVAADVGRFGKVIRSLGITAN